MEKRNSCSEGLLPPKKKQKLSHDFGVDSTLLQLCLQEEWDVIKKYVRNNVNEWDIFERDEFGLTPLHICCKKGEFSTIKLLYKAFSPLDLQKCESDGICSLIQEACYSGNIDLVDWLLQHGCSLEKEDNLLIISCNSKNLILFKWLLNNHKEALLNTKNIENLFKTIIKSKGYMEILKYLLEIISNFDNFKYFLGKCIKYACKYNLLQVLKFFNEKYNFSDLPSRTFLSKAIKSGSIEIVKWMIEIGVNTTNNEIYDSPLFEATTVGQLEIVKWLVNSGHSSVLERQMGITCLLNAASHANLEIVKWLLQNGSSLEEVDPNGCTCLLTACAYGTLELIQWLLDNGSSLKEVDKTGKTCLIIATNNQKYDIVKWLLEKGCSINESDKKDKFPFSFALKGGNMKLIQLFLQYGCTIQDKDNCILQAAKSGNINLIKWLIRNEGCSLNARNTDGTSCLLYAIKKGEIDLVKWLLRNGCSLNEMDNFGNGPMLYSIESCEIDMISYLLQNGCSLQEENVFGTTPLLKAMGKNEILAITLIDFGSSVNEEDVDGNTPLILACSYSYLEEMIEIILEEGVDDINQVELERGNTPLLLACKNASLDSVKNIIKYGGDVNKKNYSKESCIMMAAYGGKIETIKYFLDNYGFSLDERNSGAETCLVLACKQGHLDLIKWLVMEKNCSLQEAGCDGSCLSVAIENVQIEAIIWMLGNGSSLDEKHVCFYINDGKLITDDNPEYYDTCFNLLQSKGILEEVKATLTTKSSRK